MADELTDVYAISGSALHAENQRMKIIAENVANADTVPSAPGQTPYRRQVITFKNEFDKAIGAYKVEAGRVTTDPSPFQKKYDPSNPSADAQGYVQTPNVNSLLEMMDMSDANHAYQANLGVIDATKSMVQKTLAILQ